MRSAPAQTKTAEKVAPSAPSNSPATHSDTTTTATTTASPVSSTPAATVLSQTATQNVYDVVISGMGPVGLATALEAIKKGKKVLIISDRPDDFVRMQKVRLTLENVKYLLAMFPNDPKKFSGEDTKLFNDLKSNIAISLKDIERFLMRRLQEAKVAGAEIDFVYSSELKEVDLEKGRASFSGTDAKQATDVSFTYLIGADGPSHHALDLVQKNKGLENTITYETVEEVQSMQTTHAYAYLTVSRIDGADLTLPNRMNQAEIQDECLFFLTMIEDSLKKSNKKSVKCNFIGGLPEEIFNMPVDSESNRELRRQKAFEHICNAIHKALGLKPGTLKIEIVKNSKKHGAKKDKLKFQLFKTTNVQASKAGIKLKNKYLLLVGDSYDTPHYIIGSGFNTGLVQARALGGVIAGTQSIENYEAVCRELINADREVAKGVVVGSFFNKSRVQQEIQMALNETEDELKSEFMNRKS